MELTGCVILFSRLCYITSIAPPVISSSNIENTYIYKKDYILVFSECKECLKEFKEAEVGELLAECKEAEAWAEFYRVFSEH